MSFQKNNPNAVLLVEVDANGKVVWAYDYASGTENPEIPSRDAHVVSPDSGARSPEAAVPRCVWRLVAGQWRCV